MKKCFVLFTPVITSVHQYTDSISSRFKTTEMVEKPRIFSYSKAEEILLDALPVGTKNTVEDVYRKTLRSGGVTAKQSIAGVTDELSAVDLVCIIYYLVCHSSIIKFKSYSLNYTILK